MIDYTEAINSLEHQLINVIGDSKKTQLIHWQYCKDPNEINKAIITKDGNWEGLVSAKQIINITFDTNHMSYVVFWISKGE